MFSPSTSVSLANSHSIICLKLHLSPVIIIIIIIIIRGWYNRPSCGLHTLRIKSERDEARTCDVLMALRLSFLWLFISFFSSTLYFRSCLLSFFILLFVCFYYPSFFLVSFFLRFSSFLLCLILLFFSPLLISFSIYVISSSYVHFLFSVLLFFFLSFLLLCLSLSSSLLILSKTRWI
jgi:hypothetical protein